MTGQAETPLCNGGESNSGEEASAKKPVKKRCNSVATNTEIESPEHPVEQPPASEKTEEKTEEKTVRLEKEDAEGKSSLDFSLRQKVAVRFMQGRRGVQEDRHVIVPDMKSLAESEAQKEIESWETSPAALVGLFDGHRGVICSEFCSTTLSAKLVDLLSRKLPEQIAGKQGRGPPCNGASQGSPVAQSDQTAASDALKEPSPVIPLSALSFTSPAPQCPPLDACCSEDLKVLLPRLPAGLQNLMPSLYHRIFSAFRQTDKEFIAKYKVKATAGCTAVALLTLGRLGVVCWVGDSRAVAGVRRPPSVTAGCPGEPEGAVVRNGAEELVAVRLTDDHKPNRQDEKARIEKAGGHVVIVGGVARVAPSDYQERTKRMKHEQCTMGGATQQPSTLMAVSRSFGDRDLKSEGLISATPEVVLVPLTRDVRFIVLACDGVWDALSDQEVVDIISAHLSDADEATSKVVKAAFDKGSQDNLTAIVVVFDSP